MAESKPMTWTELKEVLRMGDLDLLRRDTTEQAKYQAFRASMLTEWNSIADYIRYSKFRLKYKINSEGKKVCARPLPWALLLRVSPFMVGLGLLGLRTASPISWSFLGLGGFFGLLCSKPKARSVLALYPNDFPYDFEPGILHYLLWKLGDPLTPEEVYAAIASLKGAESDFFFNPPALRSIPEIEHAHIVIRT